MTSKRLRDFIEEYFSFEDYGEVNICPYATRTNENNEDVEIELEEEVTNWFASQEFSDYSVELIETFDSPGINCYCLCVSWIEDGKLNTFNIPVYLC